MKHLELFAGIGGFRRALDLLTKDGILQFESVGYSEIDTKAIKTYLTNFHPQKNEVALGDIVAFTSDLNKIKNLPDFDLVTGGFPCQSFSMMGKQAGFEDEDRGQMFFRIIDILKIKKPRYVLLENVKNLHSHDKGRTYATIVSKLNSLGYNVISGLFNTSDFHLPQKRCRILIFASLDKIPAEFESRFDSKGVSKVFDGIYKKASVLSADTVLDFLSLNVDARYYLSEKIKPTILSDGTANFKSKSEINQLIARPLTASMHKMHRACQDNYYSKDFIESKGKVNIAKDLSKEEQSLKPIRKITPREAFLLQGFPQEFAERATKNGLSDGALYKQAGNAVSVNTIYAAVYYLIVNNLIKES